MTSCNIIKYFTHTHINQQWWRGKQFLDRVPYKDFISGHRERASFKSDRGVVNSANKYKNDVQVS